jgi:hypothetical protein
MKKSDAVKCCFCLETLSEPLVMCHQTHLGCFDCVCKHLQTSEETPTCPLCRCSLNLRFDRFVSEIVQTKKRKRNSQRFLVFLDLLELRQKSKYKTFNRLLKRFAASTTTDKEIADMKKDVVNIRDAQVSAARLKRQKLYDAQLYAHLSI